MPLYEYVCPRCERRYELLRPMASMNDPASCPRGHPGGSRALSTFAALSGGEDGDYEPASGGGCGGCAGGACACASRN